MSAEAMQSFEAKSHNKQENTHQPLHVVPNLISKNWKNKTIIYIDYHCVTCQVPSVLNWHLGQEFQSADQLCQLSVC